MIILDLFSGKGGELRRKYIEDQGHVYITLDNDPIYKSNITKDIFSIKPKDLKIFGPFDFIWASPPCTAFSVASIGKHWEPKTYAPKSLQAKQSKELVIHTLRLIKNLNPKAYLIENPRGMLRIMPFMQSLPRHTVTYCQYGEKRMKPTDLWGEVPNWIPRPACKNGDPCHDRAPRGSRTGTQGIKGADNRAVVPLELWTSLLDALEQCDE